ncbi:hypothetical protein PGRAN_15057 [Listeria grandensis FSL F6-0971]|uniref:Uncharacterized protein n=1 Tax=Listeria grandensis FSL F6-0971 TaxID=1265819 RepID=W7AXY2_9LIST|nr:hypothetical protein [Listeria grandensis]EUJ19904.1 hypothetical protein PGRAN_15057 [Listeria grandensis FSL F6-0971]
MKELWLPLTNTLEFQEHAELMTFMKDETFYFESGIVLIDDGLVSCHVDNDLNLIGADGSLFDTKSLIFKAWEKTFIWYLPAPLLRRMGDKEGVHNLVSWSKQQVPIWRAFILNQESVRSAILSTFIDLFIYKNREEFHLTLDELHNRIAYYSKEMVYTACSSLSYEKAIYFSRRNNKITFSALALAQYIDKKIKRYIYD